MTLYLLRAAMAFGLITAAMAPAIASWTADEPASAMSPGGLGSTLVEAAAQEGVESYRLVAGPHTLSSDPEWNPETTLLAIVGPQSPYAAHEVDAIEKIIMEGGTVLVVDDYGEANSVLSRFGATFERVRLVEPAHADGQTILVGGRPVPVHFDAPTALQIEPDVEHETIASSSGESFLDRDGTGVIDSGDPPGPFKIAAVMEIGAAGGRLVAVADVEPFGAREEHGEEDMALAEELVAAFVPAGGALIVDESHRPIKDPLVAGVATTLDAMYTDPWRMIFTAVAGLAVLIALVTGPLNAWSRHMFNPHRFIRRTDIEKAREDASKGADEQATRRGIHWTRRGRLAAGIGFGMLVLGIQWGNEQAALAAATMLLACAFALWQVPRPVHATREITPVRSQEDSPLQVALSLQGHGRRASVAELRDELPKEFEVLAGESWFQTTLSQRKRVTTSYETRPVVRGRYQVGPLVSRASDAFGLRSTQEVVLPAQEVLVHPRHEPITRIPFKSKVAALTLGPHLVNRAGDGSEFHALRDYQTGDSIRTVNWKASARSKNMVVNQRVHESMATITVFLDARAISAAGAVQFSPINEGCRAALSIAAGAVQARDKVKVYAYGASLTDISPGRGADQIHRLTDELAGLVPAGSMTFQEALEEVLPSLRPRTPFILISGLEDDATIPEGLRLLRQRDLQPSILVVPPGTRPEDAAIEPGAARIEAHHRDLVQHLRGLDTPTVPLKPGMPLAYSLRVGWA